MNYNEEVEEKIRLLINTLDELSNNILYTREGRAAYAASKQEAMNIFYHEKEKEE